MIDKYKKIKLEDVTRLNTPLKFFKKYKNKNKKVILKGKIVEILKESLADISEYRLIIKKNNFLITTKLLAPSDKQLNYKKDDYATIRGALAYDLEANCVVVLIHSLKLRSN